MFRRWLRPHLVFTGFDWVVRRGFRTVAGPFRSGQDAEVAMQKLGGKLTV